MLHEADGMLVFGERRGLQGGPMACPYLEHPTVLLVHWRMEMRRG